MLRSLFVIILASLVLGAGYLMLRNGVFLPVTFETRDEGPLILLGTDHVGPYHQVLPTLEKVETWARQNDIPCTTSFGEYLDDPNIVETARLKAFVGCVLEKKPEASVEIPGGFRLSERESRRYVIGTFRGSPALGPYKVYGKAQDSMREQGLSMDGSVIEVYLIEEDGSMTTRYLFPVK